MAWLESGPEREAWLAVMASLDSSETADELLESLLSSEDTSTPRPSHLMLEPTAFTTTTGTTKEEAAKSDASREKHPKKKRKRRTTCRTKQTLDELRQTARECEAFLSVLKTRQSSASSPQLKQASSVNGAAFVHAQQLIAWKNIASRQYRWRRESEQNNEQLRTAVLEQAKIVQGLERLLRRSQNVLDSTTPINRSLVDFEGARYVRRVNDLMLATSEMCAQVDGILNTHTMMANQGELRWTTEIHNAALTSATHSRHVPCSPSTVADALWKYYAQSRGSSDSYYRERIETSRDSIVKSFHVRWENTTLTTNHRVIVVTRRVRQINGVEAIVHIADFEGLDVLSTSPGFQTKGWSIVRNSSPQNEWGSPSQVFFKTNTHALSPRLDTFGDAERTANRAVYVDRHRDLDTLVKFTLTRHNEGIQRAIDSVMLAPLPCCVVAT